jgi:hypothetical protein
VGFGPPDHHQPKHRKAVTTTMNRELAKQARRERIARKQKDKAKRNYK